MLSTHRVSEPMLPVEVCLNVLEVLSVDEVKQVLYAILAMVSQDELATIMGDIVQRYLSFNNDCDGEFVPDDFGMKLMKAMHRLNAKKQNNVVYALCQWLTSNWESEELDGVTIADIMGNAKPDRSRNNETLYDLHFTEDTTESTPSTQSTEKSDVHQAKDPSSVGIQPVKKKRGRKPKPKVDKNKDQDKDVLVNIKKESLAESENEQLENIDGIRRSVRKNKGKNPKLDGDMKDSEEEAEAVEDSGDEWKGENEGMNTTVSGEPNSENTENTTQTPKRGRKRKAISTLERIKQEGLPCNVCEYVSKNYIQYNKHMSTHADEPWPRCTQCKKFKIFRDEEKLAEHVKNKHGPFICHLCDHKFGTKQALMKHGVLHGEVPQFQCSTCGKGFTTRHSLELHETVYHKGIKPFLCTHCGNGFTSKASLEEHTNMHLGVTPFECKLCDLKFARKSTLRMHNINEHNDKTSNVQCPVCEKTYRNVYILNAHMKQLHMKQDVKEEDRPKCNICGRQFKGKWELKKHVNVVHLKLKQHKCNICSKLFSTRVHLQEHTATHTRQAQFFCDICGQGFVHRVSMKAHVFRHKGEKLCECPVCHKRFDVPRFLTRHMKDVHKNVPVPKFDTPRSHLARHLRNPGKYGKKVAPPENIPQGAERIRPVSTTTKPKKTEEETTELQQVQVLDMDMYQALPPEVVQSMQVVIDESKLEGNNDDDQPKFVQILNDIGDLDGDAQELTVLKDENGENVTYDNVIVDEGEIQGEVTSEEHAVYTESTDMTLLELEIDGKISTVPVPVNTDYIQLGDEIIYLKHEEDQSKESAQ